MSRPERTTGRSSGGSYGRPDRRSATITKSARCCCVWTDHADRKRDLQDGGEPVALPYVEQRCQAVERGGRELLEIVSIHVVSSVRTAVRGSFTKESGSPSGGRNGDHSGQVNARIGRDSDFVLARSETAVSGRRTRYQMQANRVTEVAERTLSDGYAVRSGFGTATVLRKTRPHKDLLRTQRESVVGTSLRSDEGLSRQQRSHRCVLHVV
jgi:hypothetical protein